MSRFMSRSRNPFDSSDDESVSPVRSSAKASINPFDDDTDFKPQARVLKPQKANNESFMGNPFDDDDDDVSRKPSLSTKAPHQKSFHNEGDDHYNSSNLSKQAESKEHSRNRFKDRISASGDAASKKAQKIKQVGFSHASKLVDGGAAQVHKMKESTYSAFKPSNGHANTQKGSIDGKSGLSDDLRNELFKTTATRATRVHYEDSQFQQQDLEYRSTEELEGYALQKSEETTSKVENCLRVAEEIKGDATKTLLMLHDQGEQIRKTHETTLEIDHSLTTGEKLLGSLGGMFSRTWKPKKTRPVSGPAISKSDSFKRRGHHLEQRVALGLTRSNSRGRRNQIAPLASKQQTVQDKLEFEKAKQDDTLSTLSDVLDELKIMSQDMGSEIASQNVALEGLDTDVGILKERVQGANRRAQRLLRR